MLAPPYSMHAPLLRRSLGRAGLGDPYGVQVSADGSVHWNSQALAGSLPPASQQAAGAALDAIGRGDTQAAYRATVAAIASGLSAAGPVGIVAGILLELVANWQPPNATTYEPSNQTWEQTWGPYDAGPPGSFRLFANTLLRGQWDATKGTGGSLNQLYAVLESALAQAVSTWNSRNGGAPMTYIVQPIGKQIPNMGPGWTRPAVNAPIEVAAYGIAILSHTPMSGPFTFQVNSPGATATSTTSKVAAAGALAVVGGLLLAHFQGAAVSHVLSRLRKAFFR